MSDAVDHEGKSLSGGREVKKGARRKKGKGGKVKKNVAAMKGKKRLRTKGKATGKKKKSKKNAWEQMVEDNEYGELVQRFERHGPSVVAEVFVELYEVDLGRVAGNRWLGTTAMAAYSSLVYAQHADSDYHPILLVIDPSHWNTIAVRHTNDSYNNFVGQCQQHVKASGKSEFLMAVNPGEHWLVLHADWKTRSITVYDSLEAHDFSDDLEPFVTFLDDVVIPEEDAPSWELLRSATSFQKDGSACGVFALCHIRSLMDGLSDSQMRVKVAQRKVPGARRRIFRELRNGCLDKNW